MKPIRVQLSRRKGWKMPANTVSVARPTRWGNPYRVSHWTAAECVEAFRILVMTDRQGLFGALAATVVKEKLRGKNLACWCPLHDKNGLPVPCHADVLLEIANEP